MLSTESIASFLSLKLNELGANNKPKYTFEIFADIGYNKPNSSIKGIVKSFKGNVEPLINDIDVDYGFICELACPSQLSNSNIKHIRKIVDNLIANNNAKQFDLDDGQAIISFSATTPKDFKTEFALANIVPLVFTINVRYTQFAVTSNNKRWFLNDFEIPYISENILLDKEGITNKISGEDYAKTLLTNQVRFYKFLFQYDTKNELCSMLQKDILNGNFDKIYTLKYFDGKAFTEEEPFITSVSIFRNADTSTQRTKVSMFNLTFADVDNGNSTTKYYMALIDTPFDMNGENTRNFIATNDKTAQQVQIDYYNNKIFNGAAYEQIKAPNLNSIDLTSQVYKNTRNYNLFDLVNKNYAIIKVESDTLLPRYYFYFVTNASIGANNQVVYDLKLDTIQTYLFKDSIDIADCMIQRAHLNRFILAEGATGDPDKIKFNNNVDSALFEREEIQNTSKRLTLRKKIYLKINSAKNSTNELDKFLEENIAYWVYCYMSVGNYKTNGNDESYFSGFRVTGDENGGFVAPYVCFAFPVYKGTNKIILRNGVGQNYLEIGEFTQNAFFKFLDLNNDFANVYSLKLSARPPFPFMNYDTPRKSYEIKDNGDLLFNGYDGHVNKVEDGYAIYNLSVSPEIEYIGVIDGLKRESYLESGNINLNLFENGNIENIFSYSALTKSFKSPKFNPKLLSMDYKLLRISNITSSFDYDMQKIDIANIKLLFNESISPDITRQYARIKADNLIYITETENNLTGLVSSQDNSLPYSQNQLDTFLANNKNFYMQRDLNTSVSVGKVLVSNIASGSFGSLVGGMVGLASERVNSNLSLDNMRNAPESLKNADGNIIFNTSISEPGIYLEIYDSLPQEMEMANDYMFKYGFSFNKTDNIKKYINIRHYFNFIKADLDAITGVAMSNVARADFKQRFANGLRFWNSDEIAYAAENYENQIL